MFYHYLFIYFQTDWQIFKYDDSVCCRSSEDHGDGLLQRSWLVQRHVSFTDYNNYILFHVLFLLLRIPCLNNISLCIYTYIFVEKFQRYVHPAVFSSKKDIVSLPPVCGQPCSFFFSFSQSCTEYGRYCHVLQCFFLFSSIDRTQKGTKCKYFVNKSSCEFCIYHIQREYQKTSAKRADIQSSFTRVDPRRKLQEKVLGNNQVGTFPSLCCAVRLAVVRKK